jgi:hypothetical protein
MPSSSARHVVLAMTCAFATIASAGRAEAQPTAAGFAVDRLYQSAPGAGWLVMDALDMHGGFGGVVALTTSYAQDPVKLQRGSQTLPVIENESLLDFGFAATYDRFRLYLNLDAPLVIAGQSGALGGLRFAAPSVNLSKTPDSLADARLGFDARLVGRSDSTFRLGVGAQLLLPSGKQAEYDSDGTYRAMLRVLAAGDDGYLTYAAQLGLHVRPVDEPEIPGSPRGSELLFGVATGARLPVGPAPKMAVIVGPEVYGETAFESFFGQATTGMEALLSGRVEAMTDDGPQVRVKLAAGGGLLQNFGAPEWRAVVGVELFARASPAQPKD